MAPWTAPIRYDLPLGIDRGFKYQHGTNIARMDQPPPYSPSPRPFYPPLTGEGRQRERVPPTNE